jgi:hypothetical protein
VDELWHAAGCVALTSALRPVLIPVPDGPMCAFGGIGGPLPHAAPADGRGRLVGIRAAAVVDRLMTLAAP